MTYWNKYNLLNPRKEDIVSENTLLCSMVYLKKIHPKRNYVLEYCIDDLVRACFKDNWFNNLPFKSIVGKDNFCSPDQLNCYLLIGNGVRSSYIFWQLVEHLGTYDNISKRINFKRFMQPMTLFLAGYLGFSKLLFHFLLLLTMEISCRKGTNSGKQKVWLILKYAFDKKMFDKFNKEYDLDKAIRDYYPEDHPINLIGV